MAVGSVSRAVLRSRLTDTSDPFSISPLPHDSDIGAGAIDLRVGHVFLTAERSSLESIDATRPWDAAQAFSEHRIRGDGALVVQPRQFLLASTLEYIVMPTDMSGLIESRSTFGRMGLISATAAFVNPGYTGCPTLELVNLGEVPIVLQPYAPICQLILFTADEHDIRPSRYQCATRPFFARPPNRTRLAVLVMPNTEEQDE